MDDYSASYLSFLINDLYLLVLFKNSCFRFLSLNNSNTHINKLKCILIFPTP